MRNLFERMPLTSLGPVRSLARPFLAVFLTTLVAGLATAQPPRPVLIAEPPLDARAYSINLEDLPYPYPVEHFSFRFHGEDVRLAYMDVPPRDEPNGNTIVLLHGLNFFGEAWGPTIDVFRDRGFRVIVPDQIGFGRSSKPTHVRYTLNDMARNTRALLDRLGIAQAQVLGHSMGGMVATRFALLNPDLVTSLVLVNQIGLTDARLAPQPGGYDA